MQLLKKIALQILIASASAALAPAQTTSPACNNWLIAGDYGFTLQGVKLGGAPGTPTGPQVGVALTHFDGNGHLQQIDSVTVGGVQVAEFSETPTSGTYQVNSTCTGTFTLDFTDGRPTVTTWFVVVDNGNEIDTMVQGVPRGTPGVIAVGSIGKRRFTPIF
jgi:hypothetical protein